MNYVTQLQTLSREDAIKVIHDKLSSLAINALEEGLDKVYTKEQKRAMVKKSNAEWLSSLNSPSAEKYPTPPKTNWGEKAIEAGAKILAARKKAQEDGMKDQNK